MEGRNTVERYVEALCTKVRSRWQREALREELYDHLEQKVQQLITQGMEEKQAEQQAVEEMGDGKEVARKLNRVHTYTPQNIVRWAFYAATLVLGVCILIIYISIFAGFLGMEGVGAGEIVEEPIAALMGPATSIGVIGGADGPTAIYVSNSAPTFIPVIMIAFFVCLTVSVVLLVKSAIEKQNQGPPRVQ